MLALSVCQCIILSMEQMPCDNHDDCPLQGTKSGCFTDVHHKFWPRSAYVTSVEKEFRELEVNKVFICRALHNEIHARQLPPIKPYRDEMLQAITDAT